MAIEETTGSESDHDHGPEDQELDQLPAGEENESGEEMDSTVSSLTPALYLVPTPIGNREDITLRALRVLRKADLIACEDTRHTGRLLQMYGIAARKLVSIHGHNEHQSSNYVLDFVEAGKVVAYCSDAGSPAISDPGLVLVRAALARSLAVIPLPGPSASITALIASGLPTDEFLFVGFAPHKKGRRTFFDRVVEYPFSVIMYESPYRIESMVEELLARCPERHLCIARELSKKFEEFLRGTVQELHTVLKSRSALKGEIVVILQGKED